MIRRPREMRRVRLQRSELAVPATSTHFFEKAAKGPADAVFLDLEDAVTPARKDEARANAIMALNDIDWGDKIMAVRVNALDTQWAYRDIIAVSEQCPRLDLILLPKPNVAADVYAVEVLLNGIEATIGRRDPIGIEVLIETAAGLSNIEDIALASDRLEAMILGVGDLSLSLRVREQLTGAPNPRYTVLTEAGEHGVRALHWNDPWHYALAKLVTTCRAYGLRPIDGPYTDFRDEAGFRSSAQRAAALGFEGKWAIHPSQVVPANEVFAPDPGEIEWAHRIKAALEAAGGAGATAIDGKLIDIAHLKMAEAVLARDALVRGRRQG